MPAENFPKTIAALPQRRQDDFVTHLMHLEEGLAAGQIPNALYTKAKSALSRAIEQSWVEQVRKPFAWNRDYISQTDAVEKAALDEFSWHPQVNTINKMNRSAAEYPDTLAGMAIREALGEITKVLDLVKTCKDLAVKKTAAPAPESVTLKYQAPAASDTAMAQILGELTAITEEARSGIAASLEAHHVKILERFLAAQEAYLAQDAAGKTARFDVFTYAKGLGQGKADGYLMGKIETVIDTTYDRDRRCNIFTRKSGAGQVMKEAAAKDAEAICQSYVEKNMVKLAPIIEGRGDFARMSVLGRDVNPGQMEGRLQLSFGDGASFEARTQAVFSYSQYGTPFMRYPLTFHDVRMPDGSLMEQPSEKKMNEMFISVPELAPGP